VQAGGPVLAPPADGKSRLGLRPSGRGAPLSRPEMSWRGVLSGNAQGTRYFDLRSATPAHLRSAHIAPPHGFEVRTSMRMGPARSARRFSGEPKLFRDLRLLPSRHPSLGQWLPL